MAYRCFSEICLFLIHYYLRLQNKHSAYAVKLVTCIPFRNISPLFSAFQYHVDKQIKIKKVHSSMRSKMY